MGTRTKIAAGVADALVKGRQRFDRFRRQHRRGARFPEPLWSVAVDLALEHGLNRTARTLGLDYYSLKKRLEAAEPGEEAPAFLEWIGSGSAVSRECTIEVEGESGAKMRIRVTGAELPDLAAITGAFRGDG